jgi:electron transfer flavoprotein beta subunit
MQVPSILGEMMNLPSVTVIVGFEQNGEAITVKREIEGGALEVYELKTPCILATNKGINTPRYASLPGIMKAKRKPLAKHSLADVGVTDEDSKIKYSNFQLPPEKPAGKNLKRWKKLNSRKLWQKWLNFFVEEAKVLSFRR